MGYAPQHEPISLRAGPLTCLVGWRRQGKTLGWSRRRSRRPRWRPPPRQVRQLANGLFEALSLVAIGLIELTEQPRCRHPKRSTQLLQRKAAHQRILHLASDRHRQGVGPLRVGGGLSEATARKCQHLVPNAADPVLGLPWLLAFDAAPSVQDVVPRKPDDVSGVRPTGLGPLDRLAEDNTEVRATRAEPTGRAAEPVTAAPVIRGSFSASSSSCLRNASR